MRKQRKDGLETRLKLLEGACRIFAERGFWKATVAEICNHADVNMAAANYYFGGKEALYVESWRHAFEKSMAAYPPDGGVRSDAPAEERLRGRILSIMRRINDPDSHDIDMVHKEMANPTGLLAGALRESMERIFRDLSSILRELLGERATERDVRLCRMSIRAQCFGPLLVERQRKLGLPGREPPRVDPIREDVETLADHVARFSLAGIREVRRRVEAETVNTGKTPGGAQPFAGGGQL